VRANRANELIVHRQGRFFRPSEAIEQVEVIEIDTGEVILFWDTRPRDTDKLARALRVPRQVAPLSGLNHDLERVVLAGGAEDVVGLLDVVQLEVMGAELLGLDAAVAGELEQGWDRRPAHQTQW
jgi:hypothetical protein